MSVRRMNDCQSCNCELATFCDALKHCSKSLNLLEGMCVHDTIIRSTVTGNACLDNRLMQMYVNFDCLDDAAAIFMRAHDRPASTWNFLVGAFAAQRNQQKAFKLFKQMQLHNIQPSKCALIKLLSLCCSKADLNRGIQLHNLIKSSEFKTDVFVGTALVTMYGKCGNIESAYRTFDEMRRKDVVSYSAMIGVLARCGRGLDVIQLLDVMIKEGLKPDRVTYMCALDACNRPSFLEEGKTLHKLAKQSGCAQDVAVASALVSMYGKCGSLESARKVFDEIPEQNVVLWNSMLGAYVRNNQGKEALKMLDRMMCGVVKPDKITFVCVADACAKHSLLDEGERIHDLIHYYGIVEDIILSNALLNMYGKCGALDRATSMFNELHCKTIVSWNTMIALHAQHDRSILALELHSQMQQEAVIADNATFASVFDACGSCCAFSQGKMFHCSLLNADLEMDGFARSSLVNMYGTCGRVKDARLLFDMATERDLVTWNTMLVLLARSGLGSNALELFAQMQIEGVTPDSITFTCLLSACENCESLSKGNKMHLLLVNLCDCLDAPLGTALVRMYGKCGDIRRAVKVFDEVAVRDIISWSAIIAANAQHGQSKEALMLFFQMQVKGVEADNVIFVSILTACCHYGLFDEALACFRFMLGSSVVLPELEHYVCLIDLFGRAGCLIESELILVNIPSNSSAAPFLSLLSACRYHADVDRGERIARHVLEMEYDVVSSYITLSNMYSAVGQDC